MSSFSASPGTARLLRYALPAVLAGLIVSVGLSAWTDPVQAPPNGNVLPPVRLGPSAAQPGSAATNPLVWIDNTGAGPLLRLLNNSVERFVVTAAGNVGIGTTDSPHKLDVNGEVASRMHFRLRQPNYGAFFRNDNSNTYLLLTNNGDPDGSWNSLRPFYVNNATGNVGIGNGALSVRHGSGADIGVGVYESGALLNVGNASVDYPGNSGWAPSWNSNVLLSGADSTSISFHDSLSRVDTLRVAGGTFNIGENVGWGSANTRIHGELTTQGITMNSPELDIYPWGGSTEEPFRINGFSDTQPGGNYITLESGRNPANGNKRNMFLTTGMWPNFYYAQLYLKGSNGYVGVGTDNPGYKLDVAGSVHASSHPTSSDVRFKEDVRPLENVLERLEQIRGVSFNWNDLYASLGRASGQREIGFIAQELERVFPEVVSTWGDSPEEYRAVEYGRFSAVLTEAIKELKHRLEGLGDVVETRLVKASKIVGETLEVGSPDSPTGITIYDRATGDPLCVSAFNGVLTVEQGACE